MSKTASQTLRESGDMLAAGWSPDAPVRLDDQGNIVARCAATAVASVPGGNPGAWGYIARALQSLHGKLGGIWVINKDPDMTQEKMVGIFREAERLAEADRA